MSACGITVQCEMLTVYDQNTNGKNENQRTKRIKDNDNKVFHNMTRRLKQVHNKR